MEMKMGSKKPQFLLRILAFLFSISCIPAYFGTLNRAGIFIISWERRPILQMQAVEGFGYSTPIRSQAVSMLGLPVLLEEDGHLIPAPYLAVNEDLSRTVRSVGAGRYLPLDDGSLLFSTSDNTNPLTNARHYSLLIPKIFFSPLLLVVPAFWGIILIGCCFFSRRQNCQVESDVIKNILCKLLIFFTTAMLILLLFPSEYSLTKPLFSLRSETSTILPIVRRTDPFLLLLIAGCLVLGVTQRKKIWLPMFLCLILIANLFDFFRPGWDYFGVRPDSSSYLVQYDAQSIRTPGYIWFAEIALKTGKQEDIGFWRSAEGGMQLNQMGESLYRAAEKPSHGLIRVIKGQKIVLALAFILLSVALAYIISPTAAFIFSQISLSMGLLGVQNDYIMSESFSQTVTLACVACFLFLFRSRNKWLFILLSALSAIAFLIRPSNVYLVALPIVAATWMLFHFRKQVLTLSISGAVVYVILAGIPAFVCWRAYNQFLWAPNAQNANIGHALRLMQESDLSAQSDPEVKYFLEGCEIRAAAIQFANDGTLSQNEAYSVALEQAKQMGYNNVSANFLFQKAALPILKTHFQKYLSVLFKQIQFGISKSRLQREWLSYPLILLLIGVFAILGRNLKSWMGLLFVLFHNVHLIISMTNQPETRYIWATEIIFLLGAVFIFSGLAEKVMRRSADGINAAESAVETS